MKPKYRARLTVVLAGLTALALSSSVLAQRVTDPQPLFALGLQQLQARDYPAAEATYLRLIEQLPNSADAKNGLAAVYVNRNEWYRARDLLEAVVQEAPAHRGSWINLGEIYLRLSERAYGFAAKDAPGGLPTKRLVALQTVLSGGSAEHTAMPAGVRAAFQAWISVWEVRDVEKYLGFYARSFVPPSKQTLASWANARRKNLGSAKQVKILIESPEWKIMSNGQVSVSYRENLTADSFQRRGTRQLVWEQERDEDAATGWRIVKEEFSAR